MIKPKKNNAFHWWIYISACGVLVALHLGIGWMYTFRKGRETPKDDPSSLHPDDIQADKISELLPSLPIHYWERHKHQIGSMFYQNSSCANFQDIYKLKFNNLYWQYFITNHITFQLYKAFYDTRKLNGLELSVHILAMIDSTDITVKTFCQFWFEDQTEPVIVETSAYNYIWIKEWGGYEEGEYNPFIITCELPSTHTVPPSCVSLVENPCDVAKNLLAVIYNSPPRKEEIAVCVKGMDSLQDDLSARLVEWLEYLHLMGVHKVFLYQFYVHPNTQAVLDYYKSLGRIDVTPLTLPHGQPNIPILQHLYMKNFMYQQCFDELIPYNDCFYRNVYSYKYIVLLDLDEVIFPNRDDDWITLMERVRRESENGSYAAYHARNVYFFDDVSPFNPEIPPYMHMLQHVHRSRKFSPDRDYIKSFVNPEGVLAVHNHVPLLFSSDYELSYAIDRKDAQLNHYRKTCHDYVNCEPFRRHIVRDKKMWKFKDALTWNVQNVLKTLKLI